MKRKFKLLRIPVPQQHSHCYEAFSLLFSHSKTILLRGILFSSWKVSSAWTSVQHIVPSLGEEPCSGVLHNMHEVPAGPHWGGRTSVPTSSSQCYCCSCSCYCSAYYTFVLTSNQCDIECYYCFYCFWSPKCNCQYKVYKYIEIILWNIYYIL